MAKVKKTRRHRWTDDEKRELIRDVKQALKDGHTQAGYLQGRGISDSWFRRMEKRVVGNKAGRGSTGWPLDPEERKREMARRMAKRIPATGPRVKPSMTDAHLVALNEYKQLPRLEKVAWREARNLAASQISAIVANKATRGIQDRLLLNGKKPSTEITVRDQRLMRLPDPVPVVTMVPNSAPPVSTPVTLNDAILAFQVKRDHMSEFIEELIRMRGGR